MSTFRTPVGPQPSRVYWRRRLVVLLGLVAVIAIVVLIMVQPRGTADEPTGGTTPSSTPSSTPSGSSTGVPSGAACDPAKVTVEPGTDAASYDAGQNPVLTFSLKSTMTAPCTMSAGSDVQEFQIISGEELIWSSKDCQSDPVAATIELKPGVPFQGSNLTWDRTRSSADTCDIARDPVIAGGASYHLKVIVGGIESAETRQFLLY